MPPILRHIVLGLPKYESIPENQNQFGQVLGWIYIYIYIYIYIMRTDPTWLTQPYDPGIHGKSPPRLFGIIRQDPAPLLALSEKFHLLCFGLRLDSAPRFRFPPWKLYVSYTMVIPCYTYHKPVLLGHHPRLTQPTNKKAGDPRLVLVNICELGKSSCTMSYPYYAPCMEYLRTFALKFTQV